ncbi:MAG: aminotransferase class IV [Bacteroidota bacterium]
MLDIVYIDGDFVKHDEARLPLNDLGLLRAYGVFDYFRFVAGKLQFFPDHWLRFQRSAAQLDLALDLTVDEASNLIHELIGRNGQPDGGIRLLLTGGSANDGYTPVQPRFMAMEFAHRQPSSQLYKEGASVLIHRYERQAPSIKSIDYIEGIRLLKRLKANRFDFPIYMDRDNHLRESDRSNFMIVKHGKLITPVDEILLGITRKHVLRLAHQLDIPIEERHVSLKEFLQADEALLTSSTKGVMPITRSDHGLVNGGAVGSVTRQLMQHWPDYTAISRA